MTRLLLILTFLTSLAHGQISVSTLSTAANNPSVEAFGKKFFNCLKKEDKKAFNDLLISVDRIKAGMETHITDTAKKRIWLEKNATDGPKVYPRYIEMCQTSFDKIITSGKQDNVKWSKIKYEGFEYRPQKKDEHIQHIVSRLNFSYDGKPYSIDITDAQYLKDGWYMSVLKVESYKDKTTLGGH